MHRVFWTGINIGEFLFQGFEALTTKGFIAICLGLGCVAFIAEGLRALFLHIQNNGCNLMTKFTTFEQLSLSVSSNATYSTYICRAVQSLIFAINATLAYIMMCVIMTYNVALFLSVIIGSGLGYAVFHTSPVSVRLVVRKIVEEPTLLPENDDVVSDIHEIGPGGAILTLETNRLIHNLRSDRDVSATNANC